MPKRKKKPDKFEGFERPKQNWFKMPRSWTNITAQMTSMAEVKVVEYVLRHTWGYQEYGIAKKISIDEFVRGRKKKDGSRMDRGTGLSRQSAINGLRRAVREGFLEVEVDKSDLGRIKKFYKLRMKGSKNEKGSKSYTPEVKKLTPRGQKSNPPTEIDTLDRNFSKKGKKKLGETLKKLGLK